MRRCRVGLLAGIACLVASTPGLRSAAETLDDFEAYESGAIVGPGARSSPWCRVGVATLDNITATSNGSRVITGRQSGQYLVQWPARFGSARYRFEQPRDLSAFRGFSVALKSDVASSGTEAKLLISGAETIYVARASEPVSPAPHIYSTSFDAAAFERVDGSAAFADVLKSVETLGFNVLNAKPEGSDEQSELIVIDDLMLLETDSQPPVTAEPE